MSVEKPSLIKILVLTARPKTLGASIAPVIMGTALAIRDGTFHPLSALCSLLGGVLLQILANYANDYFDFIKGADRENRLGPTRATSAGWLTINQMRMALLVLVLISLIPGGYLVYRGGIPILLIGVFSIVFAFAYTVGPLPLAYLGLGDVFVLVFFGFVAVIGTHYVQSLQFSVLDLLVGLGAGCLAVAILTVNNFRDIESDKEAGKKTLAVRLGGKFAQIEYVCMLLISILLIPILLAFIVEGQKEILVVTILIVPAFRLISTIFQQKGEALNLLLARTSRLLLVYSLLFSIMWII